jgi:hypothetical protein
LVVLFLWERSCRILSHVYEPRRYNALCITIHWESIMQAKKKTADILTVGLLFVLLVVAFLARSPYSVPVPIRDSGIFLNIGSEVLHGKILYQQTWDNKQPLLYGFNALGLWLGHGSVWGVWGLELVLLLIVFYISYRLIRPALTPFSAFAVIAIAFLAIFPFMGGNYSEEYSLVFQMGILGVLFGVYLPDRKRFSRSAGALATGVLAGLVFCIKQTYLDIPLTVLIFMGFLAWLEKDRGILRNFFLVGSGFLLVNLPVFLYFQVNGALRDYVVNAFLFNRYYAYQTILMRISSLVEMSKFVSSHPFFFLVACLWLEIVVLLALKMRQVLSSNNAGSKQARAMNLDSLRAELAQLDWRHPGPATFLFLGLIDLPIFFFTISLSGKLWTHYYVPFYPAILLLLAGSLAYLYRCTQIPNKTEILNSLLVVVLVVGSIPPLNLVLTNLRKPEGGDARSATAAYLQSVTTPDEPILVWGWESVIYFLAQRQSPTRFALPFALYVNTPYLDEYASILLKEVQAHPPAYIADLREPDMPFIDGRTAETCVSGNQMTNQRMVDFLAFICANYVEDRSFDTINIYKLRQKQ